MAIEKMLLVNVLGKLDTMDTALERVCIDEDFHPESTLTFLEDSKATPPSARITPIRRCCRPSTSFPNLTRRRLS